MSRKVLGRIIVCALALAMVLGLCMVGAMADAAATPTTSANATVTPVPSASGDWSASITSDNATGVIGRTITVRISVGSTVGFYNFSVSATKGTVSQSTIPLSDKGSATFTVTTTEAGDGVITIDCATGGGTKTVSFSSYTPELTLKSYSGVFDANGNSFTYKIKNEAKNGQIMVTPSDTSTGSFISQVGNTINVFGVSAYTVEYQDLNGNPYCSSVVYNVTKQKAVLAVSNQSVTMRVGESVTVDYETTSTNKTITAKSNGTSIAEDPTVDTTNKTIKITGKAVGTTSINVTDTSGGNYSDSNPVGILVNVVDSSATLIKATPNYVKLDKDTSSKKVTINISKAQLDEGVAEVNIKVAKPTGTAYRGVYIDGTRKSGGNTYYVKSNGDVSFDVTLKARYSGSYTLKVTNGSSSITFPVYITGYTTLPQTGPDYSMVYIFAALLTVALGGIVLVNVLRRKDENIK